MAYNNGLIGERVRKCGRIVGIVNLNVKGSKRPGTLCIGGLEFYPNGTDIIVVGCSAEGLGIAVECQPCGQRGPAGTTTTTDGGDGQGITGIFIGKRGARYLEAERVIFLGHLRRNRGSHHRCMVDRGHRQGKIIGNRQSRCGAVAGCDHHVEHAHILYRWLAREGTGCRIEGKPCRQPISAGQRSTQR